MPSELLKISFDPQSYARVYEGFKQKGAALAETIRVAMTINLLKMQTGTVANLSGAMLQRQTGTLAASIRVEQPEYTDGGTRIKGALVGGEGSAFYGVYHQRGAPSLWEIVHAKAAALHFILDGRDVFVKSVTHPPLPVTQFFPTAENTKDWFRAELENALRQAMGE